MKKLSKEETIELVMRNYGWTREEAIENIVWDADEEIVEFYETINKIWY